MIRNGLRCHLAGWLSRADDDELERLNWAVGYRPHVGQAVPKGEWLTWLMLAGRGFGKTRAGAEWISALARADGSLRIALVGATIEEVGNVMVRGRSGLMAVAAPGDDVLYVPSTGIVSFASGAQAFVYSGENPDKLRGPEHHYAWCDELAKWAYPEAAWRNLQLGLRLGVRPRALVTTTPRPLHLLRELVADPATAVRGGRTSDNPFLPRAFVRAVEGRYGGTLLGRQELDGEIVEEVEGALWTRAGIEAARVDPLTVFLPPTGSLRLPRGGEGLIRVVIGVDPPASAHGDACGIVAVGLGSDGNRLCAGRSYSRRALARGLGRGGGGGGRSPRRRQGGGRSQ